PDPVADEIRSRTRRLAPATLTTDREVLDAGDDAVAGRLDARRGSAAPSGAEAAARRRGQGVEEGRGRSHVDESRASQFLAGHHGTTGAGRGSGVQTSRLARAGPGETALPRQTFRTRPDRHGADGRGAEGAGPLREPHLPRPRSHKGDGRGFET